MVLVSDAITTSKSSVPKVIPGGIQRKRAHCGNEPKHNYRVKYLGVSGSGVEFIGTDWQSPGFVETQMYSI